MFLFACRWEKITEKLWHKNKQIQSRLIEFNETFNSRKRENKLYLSIEIVSVVFVLIHLIKMNFFIICGWGTKLHASPKEDHCGCLIGLPTNLMKAKDYGDSHGRNFVNCLEFLQWLINCHEEKRKKLLTTLLCNL